MRLILMLENREGAWINSIQNDTELQSLDVTLAQNMEIMIRNDGRVLWINEGGRCLLRVCCIDGEIMINDQRKTLESHDEF